MKRQGLSCLFYLYFSRIPDEKQVKKQPLFVLIFALGLSSSSQLFR